MRNTIKCAAASFLLLCSSSAWAAPPSGPVFYGDPPDETHPWAIHDRNRPQPVIVTPGTFSTQDQPGKPPADAIILFDGKDLSKWESAKDGSPARWELKDGAMMVNKTGEIRTKEKFSDCQLHVEWTAPTEIRGESQGRGNSGIFLLGAVEVQVLDNYNNPSYADGMAGSVYGTNPPMANALRPPGQWQAYDIIFRRPIYKDGKCLDPGHVTVLVNGVVVQDATALEGSGGHMGRTKAGPLPESGALRLQDHGNPVRFRNIWYRPLPPRSVQGGTDGALTPEAATAKRKEIAASIRKDAATLKDSSNPLPEMLRLAESLVYEKEEAALQQVSQMANQYVVSIKALPAQRLSGKKDEVKYIESVLRYLTKWKVFPQDFAPKAELEKIIKEQGWDKK